MTNGEERAALEPVQARANWLAELVGGANRDTARRAEARGAFGCNRCSRRFPTKELRTQHHDQVHR